MAEVTLGPDELDLLTRHVEAMETVAENSTALVAAVEANTEAMAGITKDETLALQVEELIKFNERIADKDLGVYMNPNMHPDRYDGGAGVSQAAFDTSMEEANKVDAVKHRIKNPIDWNN